MKNTNVLVIGLLVSTMMACGSSKSSKTSAPATKSAPVAVKLNAQGAAALAKAAAGLRLADSTTATLGGKVVLDAEGNSITSPIITTVAGPMSFNAVVALGQGLILAIGPGIAYPADYHPIFDENGTQINKLPGLESVLLSSGELASDCHGFLLINLQESTTSCGVNKDFVESEFPFDQNTSVSQFYKSNGMGYVVGLSADHTHMVSYDVATRTVKTVSDHQLQLVAVTSSRSIIAQGASGYSIITVDGKETSINAQYMGEYSKGLVFGSSAQKIVTFDSSLNTTDIAYNISSSYTEAVSIKNDVIKFIIGSVGDGSQPATQVVTVDLNTQAVSTEVLMNKYAKNAAATDAFIFIITDDKAYRINQGLGLTAPAPIEIDLPLDAVFTRIGSTFMVSTATKTMIADKTTGELKDLPAHFDSIEAL